jgi:hypothetical protein
MQWPETRDRLPACEHLAAWTERNARFSAQIGDAMLERGICVGGRMSQEKIRTCVYTKTNARENQIRDTGETPSSDRSSRPDRRGSHADTVAEFSL